jgi:hypothetical protein
MRTTLTALQRLVLISSACLLAAVPIRRPIPACHHMLAQFTEKLQKRFRITQQPESQTLRLKLTLTGAATTTPVLGTLSRFDLARGIYNGVWVPVSAHWQPPKPGSKKVPCSWLSS